MRSLILPSNHNSCCACGQDIHDRMEFKLLISNQDNGGKNDHFPVEQVHQDAGFLENFDVQQGNFCDLQACGADQGNGGRPDAVEDLLDCCGVLKSVQNPRNDQDADDRRQDQAASGDDAAQNAHGGKTDIGGHVDAERPRCGLGHGDHVGNVIGGEPAHAGGHIVKEREGGQAASDGEEAGFKEFPGHL